jgi:CubicO group peptidase (beta-lactamase class C family)
MQRAKAHILYFVLTAISIATLAACYRLHAQSASARVDKLFAEWNKADSPGCSVGVSRNGTVLYEHGYGMANLESGGAITPAFVFHVASISKQFTAMSILLLAEHAKLSLDDDVRKYIPEWANHGSRITIRHLLTHTSGLRDAYVLSDLSPPRNQIVDRMDAIGSILARASGLNFAPGAEFEYNNAGYTLLATIVKRASGQSLRAFTEANIFKPLGMTHTHFHDDPTMIVPNRAVGYHLDADGFHIALHDDLGHLVGNTGLFTTTRDLLLWEQNFVDARVGGPGPVAAMQTPAIPTGWSEGSSYGFGLEIGKYRGLRTIGHGGSDPGYDAYVTRYPDHGFVIAVLCNLDNVGSPRLAERVTDIYLSNALSRPSVPSAGLTPPRVLPAEVVASKAGLYHDPSNGALVRIFVRNGKLMEHDGVDEGEGVELMPLSVNRVAVVGTQTAIEFVPAASGRPQEIHVAGPWHKPFVLQQVTTSFAPSSADLRTFAGEYTSSELEGVYTRFRSRDSDSRQSRYCAAACLPRCLYGNPYWHVKVFAGRSRRNNGIRNLHSWRARAALRPTKSVNNTPVGGPGGLIRHSSDQSCRQSAPARSCV